MSWKAWIGAVALAVGLAAAPAAEAQQAEPSARQVQLASQLISLLGADDTLGDLFRDMSPMIAAGMAQELHLNSAEQTRLGEILQEEFHNSMPELISAVTRIYATGMTEEELEQSIAFMQTPAGRAWVRLQETSKQEIERAGGEIGMRVGMVALTRLMQERQQRQGRQNG